MALVLPDRGSLTEGHCLLIPMRHVVATTALDEDEYDELSMFKRCIVDMFVAQDKDAIFMETSTSLHRQYHTAVHCVPLSKNDGAMAPMYFKAS